nr:MAG TPA: hypothetical protein [Caudoviricetes sp.]
MMEDITKQEYSAWLEESLKTVLEFKPSSICIAATAEDGTTKTGYFNATGQDKAMFAANIMSDVVMDIIKINAREIKGLLDETEQGG